MAVAFFYHVILWCRGPRQLILKPGHEDHPQRRVTHVEALKKGDSERYRGTIMGASTYVSQRRVKIKAKFIAHMQDPAGLRPYIPHCHTLQVFGFVPVTSSLVDELAKAFWCPAPPYLQGSTWATWEFLKMEVP